MLERVKRVIPILLLGLFSVPLCALAQSAADSSPIALPDSLSYEAHFIPADTLEQSLFIDSLSVIRSDFPDTVLAAAPDTIQSKPPRKDALDDPVAYESNDSMIWTRGGYASLFGDSKVN